MDASIEECASIYRSFHDDRMTAIFYAGTVICIWVWFIRKPKITKPFPPLAGGVVVRIRQLETTTPFFNMFPENLGYKLGRLGIAVGFLVN